MKQCLILHRYCDELQPDSLNRVPFELLLSRYHMVGRWHPENGLDLLEDVGRGPEGGNHEQVSLGAAVFLRNSNR